MSQSLDKWREKLAYLQEQEAIISDPAQKFTVAEQIKEAKAKIEALEAPIWRGLPWRRLGSVAAMLVLLGVVGIALFKYWNAPEIKHLAAGAGFSVFAKPEQDAQIINRVRAGDQFDLLVGKGSNNWAFVRYRGREGWVLSQDMSVVTSIDVGRGLGFRGSYWQVFFTAPQPKEGAPNEFGIDARFAQAITQCKTSLDIAIYELNNRLVTNSILDAHTRGVNIRIVTDEGRMKDELSTIGELKQSGIAIVAKSPKGGRIMHSKFAIMDNATVWTGSWNYTDTGTFRNNENVVAIDSPEIAAAFANRFQKLLDDGPERSKPTGEDAVTETRQLPHGVRVLFAPEDPTLDALATALREARKSIRFMTFSFTVDDLAEILQQQAAKGVRVQGIAEKQLARSRVAKSLLTASVPNLEVRVDDNPRYLRHNCVIVDDRVVLMGSMNISSAGATRNDENLIVIPDAALAVKFIEEFERLWKTAKNANAATSSDPVE